MPRAVDNIITAYAYSDRLYNQWDAKWKNTVYSDGANLYDSGCGIFATANAVYSLNGSKMDPQAMADYVYRNGSWDNRGVLDTNVFWNQLEQEFGSKYNFQIDSKNDGSVNDSKLINHLKNGGVAVAHVYNHFIAIDGYRTSDGYFHVIESAVNNNSRKLSAAGWVSPYKLQNSSTKTNVNWYALISKCSVTELTIKPTAYPSTINQGTSFNLTGTIKSRYKITQFKGEIIKDSAAKQSYSYNPNATTVNIATSPVNNKMVFNTLAAGSYKLKYTAKDSSGKTKTWTCSFTVKSTASTLAIRPFSYPTSINKGSSYNLTGTISSNYNITQFKGEILLNSTVKQSYTAYPNAKSVSIGSSTVNTNMKFGSLAAGTYTLRYTAKDSSGKTATWSKSFQVKSTSSTLAIRPSSYPTTIYKGASFNLTGTVSSGYKITRFQGQILQGSSVKQSYAITPNSTSVNIASSAVNTYMKFGSLARGTYTLKYLASDSSGKTVSWVHTFTVK